MNWPRHVIEHSRSRDGQLSVLMICAILSDRDGFFSLPRATLASFCRLSIRQTQRHLSNLIAIGELLVITKPAGRRQPTYKVARMA